MSKRMRRRCLGLAGVCIWLLSGTPVQAADAPGNCATVLAAADRLLALPDAPTTLVAARLVSDREDLPAHCVIDGYIAPQVHFELRMPAANWNGKLLMQGCGGLCGRIPSAACDDVLARGYAVVTTDMGHQAPPFQSLWAYDNRQAEIDFAYRATHVVTVAAKLLVEIHYGNAARYAYFRGCSTGGRQGMVEAQRFPEDFDGIIAGAPVLNETATAALHLIWSGQANLDPVTDEPILSATEVAAAGAAIRQACAAADGMIVDPRRCDWRTVIRDCGSDCGGERGFQVFDRLYGGPRDSAGRYLLPGGVMPGSEYEWVPNFVGIDGPAVFHPDGPIKQLYQTLIFFDDPGPGVSARAFDFDTDPPRLGLMEPIYNAQNPDLRKFRDAGGKLIMYQGWDDIEVTPLNTVDYYETMQRTMGGAGVAREFARLFMLPGVAHCRRGPGADSVDWLSYLERWVEQGTPPDEVIAHHLVQEQSYLGLPRPRFPLPAEAYDNTRRIRPYPDQPD